MRLAIVLVALLSLVGCQTTHMVPIIVNKPVFVEIPKGLLRCDKLKASDYPDPNTLTDKQVALLINHLEMINGVCYVNMKGIKKFQEAAKKKFPKN